MFSFLVKTLISWDAQGPGPPGDSLSHLLFLLLPAFSPPLLPPSYLPSPSLLDSLNTCLCQRPHEVPRYQTEHHKIFPKGLTEKGGGRCPKQRKEHCEGLEVRGDKKGLGGSGDSGDPHPVPGPTNHPQHLALPRYRLGGPGKGGVQPWPSSQTTLRNKGT